MPFFLVHYGLFWSVHGTFVVTLFGGGLFGGGAGELGVGGASVPGPWGALPAALVVPTLALVASHGVSFVRNYLGRGEDRSLAPKALMVQPYMRVFTLQVVILAGGFTALALGGSAAPLVLLVVVKTAVDVHAHLREHARVIDGGGLAAVDQTWTH